MNFKKRLTSVVFVIAFLVVVGTVGFIFMNNEDNSDEYDFWTTRKETIQLWYTDDALTDYLNNKAVAFYEDTDIRVETKLVSGLEYLENINKASISDEEATPDVYIITNDSLEKAYLAGLATNVQNTELLADAAKFSDTARNAVTYNDSIVGYPFYFETSALLYNKTHLERMALEAVLNEYPEYYPASEVTSAEAATNSEEQEEQDISSVTVSMLSEEAQALVSATQQGLVPDSVVDILNFADLYSAPQNVEYFFRWDVSDIFYNYFFVGNYINVGGAAGDDKDQIDIYNAGSIASLLAFQELGRFFSVEEEETSYADIMQEFLEGKTIFTIATSDALQLLENAKAEGTFAYEYGVAALPNINDEMDTKGMSVTNALVVNGYSAHKEAANRFAAYLADEASSDLYSKTGKIPVRLQIEYDNANMAVYVKNYEKSVPMPKMIETSNFWVELEICFAKVWGGEDANEEIRALSEQIKTQLTGEPYIEEVLASPEVQLLSAEESMDTAEYE
ncbi:MAG: extracellular solute-binding protein [Lachnospiraceae bacterium]|nr:extracellular solute-binding protein [Lachnospiraceae bacterium]